MQGLPQILLCNFLTQGKGFFKILLQVPQKRGAVEQGVAFKMQEKTAIIQIYRAQHTDFIVEQAGGAATNGLIPMLDVVPEKLHQRVPVFLGSKNEVDRITRYHKETR